MIVASLLAIGVACIVYVLYIKSKNTAQYYEKRNLKYFGLLPVLKITFRTIFSKSDFSDAIRENKVFPNEPIFGAFSPMARSYVINDPEAYKRITIRDFNHFQDHFGIGNATDEILGNVLIQLKGENWHQMRSTLSPAFTGSKMRLMFELISECADDIVKHFLTRSRNGERINVEMKDFFSRYANDVIATCAFGISVNSFVDTHNEFFTYGENLVNASPWLSILKFLVVHFLPKVAKAFNIKIIDSKTFKNIILETIETRQKYNIIRPDMVNMLMQVREGKMTNDDKNNEISKEITEEFAPVQEFDIANDDVTRKWDDNELVAQCLQFFLAGREPPSIALTFAAHELVSNPEVQKMLYEEISEMNKQLDGEQISYDSIQKMKYLDQFICETLRKWPPVPVSERQCVKDYVYDDGNLKFNIEKGSVMAFSVIQTHHDPKYFPNPDKFDPERFNEKNKLNIVPGTYNPFSIGPRNCIASRFALMEMKIILYYLVLNFSFEVNEKTQIPLKLQKFSMTAKKGVHLELKPRKF